MLGSFRSSLSLSHRRAFSSARKPRIKLLYIPRGGPVELSIWNQLLLEEGLLKATTDNWAIINGSAQTEPSIVLGISGKPEEWVNVEEAERCRIPLIRRFTGGLSVFPFPAECNPCTLLSDPPHFSRFSSSAPGGTVYVDKGTRFVTLVCNQESLPQVECYPRPIMTWTGEFYSPVFEALSQPGTTPGDRVGFNVRDNDYCIGDLKFGGNAQGITRNRWLHHTSFLWESDLEQMSRFLTMPKKVPSYRQGRSHREFVRPLSEYPVHRPELLRSQSQASLSARLLEESVILRLQDFFEIEPVGLESIWFASELECHRCNKVLGYR